jgi:hypothetical protein
MGTSAGSERWASGSVAQEQSKSKFKRMPVLNRQAGMRPDLFMFILEQVPHSAFG